MRFRVHGVNLISKALNCSSRNPLPVPHFHRSIQGVVAVLHLHVPGLVSSENPNFKVSKRWHVGHSHLHDQDHRTGKEGEKIFLIGLAADIGLAAGKGVTGYLSDSTAIIADAVHSVSDVVLSGIALVSYRVARAPKDKEHPYGHGKFETLGALGVSSMLLVTAGGIAWHTLDLLMVLLSATPDAVNQSLCTLDYDCSHHHVGHHHGIDMKHPVLALNMTVVSILTKEGLYWITKRAGERVGSGLMKANAWHHRADAISSVVALIGVGGSILGVKFLDPLAGLLVSGMILKVGLETGYQSVMELVDAAVPLECLDPIKQTIVLVERVKGCHRLRGRRAGSSLYLDVHIEVDPFSSVSAAHDIGETVRKQIHASHPEVSEVFIHIDPSISYLSSGMEDEWDNSQSNVYLENAHVDDIVNSVLSSKFSKRMVVEHITHHFLRGKILLQVEVSMPSDLVIRDAKWMAGEAETEILKAASNINRVSILLRLHNPGAPQFQQTIER